MRHITYIIITLLFCSCENSIKNNVLVDNNCDNNKLVDYVYPINNFIEEKTLVYSLRNNKDSNIEYSRQEFKSKIDKDSLLSKVSINSIGTVTDSTIYIIRNGIPEIQESYTRVIDLNPNILQTKSVITGNKFCEFTTYNEVYSYKIPTEKGVMTREFKGNTTHKMYVKKTFNGVEYDCAIYESDKTMTVSFNGRKDEIKGNWKGCACKNLGELYSQTTLENGLVLNNQLEEIIEGIENN